MLNLAVEKGFTGAEGKGVTVGEDADISRSHLRRVNWVGDRRSGGGMVIPCCWKASAIGAPPTAALMAAASCGLAAVTVSPSGRVTVVGPAGGDSPSSADASSSWLPGSSGES